MLNKLIETIALVEQSSVADVVLYGLYFEKTTVTKNTIIDEQDKVPNYLYFVNSGFIRLFYYDANGEEQTNYLCATASFIASFSSLINKTPATENVECITDCELLRISVANTKLLIEKSENFKRFSLVMFEKALSSSAVRANNLATLSGEQRYAKMITEQPHFVQNIPLQYIASYLGIQPQSLSRIRKNN